MANHLNEQDSNKIILNKKQERRLNRSIIAVVSAVAAFALCLVVAGLAFAATTGKSDLVYTGKPQTLLKDVETYNSVTDKSRTCYSLNGEDWYGETTGSLAKDVSKYIVGTDAGTYTVYYANQTRPRVTKSWESPTNINSIKVTIKQATTSTSVTSVGESVSFTGAGQQLVKEASTNFGEIEYSLDNVNWSKTEPTASEATTYTVYWKVVGTNNYTGTNGSFTVKVTPFPPPTVTVEGNSGLTYNTKDQQLIKSSSTNHGTLKYSLDNTSWKTDSTQITGKNAGEYTVYWKVDAGSDGGTNWSGISGSVKVNIGKANLPDNLVTKNDGLIYNGKAQNLVTVNRAGLPSDVKIYFRLSHSPNQVSESETIPSETEISDSLLYDHYYVYYRVDGGQNYNSRDYKRDYLNRIDANSPDFKVSIDPAPLKSIEFDQTLPLTYTGSELSVSIKKVWAGKDGDLVEVPSDCYTIVSSSSTTSATNPGTYTVKVEKTLLATNFSGDTTGSWTINPSYKFTNGALTIKGSDGTYAASAKGYEFKDSDITPEFKVEADGTTLTKDVDYKVVVSESTTTAKNVGTYTIKVRGIGKYNNALNTASATWEITKMQVATADIAWTEKTYNGESQIPGITNVKNSKGGVITYGTDYTIVYKNSSETDVTEAIDAGTYTAVISGINNYAGYVTKTWTIKKADLPSNAVVKATGLVYNGKAQNLVIEDLPAGCNAFYKEGIGALALTAAETDAIPTETNHITDAHYYIYYKIDGGNNYNDKSYDFTNPLEAKIDPAPLKSIEFNQTLPLTYTGSELSVTIKKVLAGKDGDLVEVPSTCYTIVSNDSTTSATNPGTYTVKVEKTVLGTNFSGDTTGSWTINPSYKFTNGALTIKGSDDQFAVTAAGYQYKNGDYTPEFKVEADGKTLTKDTDYEVVVSESTLTAKEKGTYTIKVKGIGDYSNPSNVATATWSITNAQLGTATISSDSKMYDGDAFKPSVTEVKDKLGNVVPVGSYDVAWQTSEGATTDSINAGSYKVVITAKDGSNFIGKVEKTYTITKSDYLTKNASKIVTAKENLVYTGSNQELVTISEELQQTKFAGVTIYFGEFLTGGSFASESTNIPTGLDAYTKLGQKQYVVYYRIDGGDNYDSVAYKPTQPMIVKIGKGTPVPTITPKTNAAYLTYDGTAKQLVDTATVNFGVLQLNYKKAGETNWALENWVTSDNFDQIAPIAAGEYLIGYKVAADLNWNAIESTQESEMTKVTIAGREIKDAWITLKNLPWKDDEQSVEIKIVDAGLSDYELVEDVDYSVEGTRTAKDPGEYTITIKGKGNYAGEIEKTWKIINIKAVLDKTEFTYDGYEHAVEVTVSKVNGDALVEGQDYIVLTSQSKTKATDAGTYEVVVETRGEYAEAGTLKLKWTINQAELKDEDLILLPDYFLWTGKEWSPEVFVQHRLGNNLLATDLVQDEDFEFVEGTELKATDAGGHKVIIKGIGNYKGQVEKTWMIQGIPMGVIITYIDEDTFTYNGQEQGPNLKVALGLLDEGEDYVITGTTKATQAGDYQVTITGKGQYYGTLTFDWKIEARDLSECQSLLLNKDTGLPCDSYEYLPTSILTYNEEIMIVDINLLDKTNDAEIIQALLNKDYKTAIIEKLKGTKAYIGVLKKDTDYSLSENSVTSKKSNEKGAYNITAIGKGNYKGTVTKEWVIALQSQMVKYNEFRVANDNTTYSGEEIKPQLQVRAIDAQSLQLTWVDIDQCDCYKVTDAKTGKEYKDISELNAGTYTLRVEGIADKDKYGSKEVQWTIQKKKVVASYDKTETVYDGTVQRPVLSLDGIVAADQSKIKIDETKAISVLPPEHAGTYYMYTQVEISDDFNKNNYTFTIEGEDEGTSIVQYLKNLIGQVSIEQQIKDKIQELIGMVTNDMFFATKFVINPRVVGVEWSDTEFTYDGLYHAPTATATNVVEGDYCKITVEGYQKNAGSYTAKVTGLSIITGLIGDYKLAEGESICPFVINAKSIADKHVVSIEKLTDNLVYNARIQQPEISVTDVQTLSALEEGVDYTIDSTSRYSAIDAGDYTLTIKGQGNYYGTREVAWKILPRDLHAEGVSVELSTNQLVYNADEQGPAVLVSYTNLDNMVETRDYYITGTTSAKDVYNILGLTDYTVYVHGTGNFTGIVQRDWDIVPLDLSKVTNLQITYVDATFNNESQMPEAISISADGEILPLDEVEFTNDSAAKDAGKHIVTLKGEVKRNKYLNYNVINSKTDEWTINQKEVTESSFNIDMGTYEYNAQEQTVDPVLVDKETGATLVEGTDYDLTLTATAKNADTYTVGIQFKNNYSGYFTKNWTIEKTSIDTADISFDELTFNGKNQSPSYTMSKTLAGAEVTLVENVDFVLLNATAEPFGKVMNANEYPIVVQGIGNFTGTRYGFVVTVNPLDVSETVEATIVESMIYTSAELKAAVVAKVILPGDVSKTALVEDEDYTITYENNIEVGTATATLTFINNYTGSKTLQFQIVYSETHQVEFFVDGVSYTKQDNIPHGGLVTKPANPGKNGYIFAGWTIASEGLSDTGQVYLFDTPLMRDLKLDAKWISEEQVENVVVKTQSSGLDASSSLSIKDIPLTDEEEAAIAAGKTLDVSMTINVAGNVDAQEKSGIEALLKKNQSIGTYLNITIEKYLDGELSGTVHETINPVTITVNIPENLREEGREYSIIRVHNGSATIIAENLKADENWNISFTSDRFSTYALVTDDTHVIKIGPSTGDTNTNLLLMLMLMLVGSGVLFGGAAYSRVREERRSFRECATFGRQGK